jgi:hypothetical protein
MDMFHHECWRLLIYISVLGLAGCSADRETANVDASISADLSADRVGQPPTIDATAGDGGDGPAPSDAGIDAREIDMATPSKPCASATATYTPQHFDNILENFDQTKTLRLEGPKWNNTLVRNCTIHDTKDNGIFLKNVKNVVITACSFRNIGGHAGVQLSSTGSTEDVIIDGNTFVRMSNNAISASQRAGDGIDHKHLRILHNEVRDTGLHTGWAGHVHAFYIQTQDVYIAGNTIVGKRDGNGISIRSSGIVRCNEISGISDTDKPAIRYFSDHTKGPSDRLVIEHNNIESPAIGIDLYEPVKRYDDTPPNGHVVKNFIIHHNVVRAREPIRVASAYRRAPFSVDVNANKEIKTN